MRAHFSEYFRPTASQFRTLWANAIFSFDANVLLDLYRFSHDSRNELLELMKTQSTRIWVSNQAALEFHRNRLEAIEGVHRSTKEILAQLSKATQILEEECKQHPYLSAKMVNGIKAKLKECSSAITSAQQNHPDLSKDDEIADSIAAVLDGRIGEPYSPEKLEEFTKLIQVRYDRKIPPGYEDAKNKPIELSRGDALIWFQLSDKAKAAQKPMIFVTEDNKEDWWLRHKGQTLMPRPELRREFLEVTGQEFFAYNTLNFVEHAKRAVDNKLGDAVIAEAREISKQKESTERKKTVFSDAIQRHLASEQNRRFREWFDRKNVDPHQLFSWTSRLADLELKETILRKRLGDPAWEGHDREELLSEIANIREAKAQARSEYELWRIEQMDKKEPTSRESPPEVEF